MKPIISVELMRLSDENTIKNKIPSKELMYKAGKAVFEAGCFKGPAAIVCGSGNNAGDGYVMALEMKKAKIPCTLVLLGDKFSKDGLYYFQKCKEEGIEYFYFTEDFSFDPYKEIVDCIFGTGFKGEPRGISKDAINKINASKKRVVSVDINSGLNGDTGKYETAVKSDLTVSVGYFKTGFFIGDAPKVIGELKNVDIGIELLDEPWILIEDKDELPQNYTYIEPDKYENIIDELKSKANGEFVRYENVLTDGKDVLIIRGKTNYGD